MTAVFVVLGAIVGAPLRYLLDRAVQRRNRTAVPWGTMSVNLIACAGLGLLAGAAAAGVASHDVQALLGTGFCATLSTYSTFSYETLRLIEDGKARFAVVNVVVSIVAGLGAAALGNAVAQGLWN